MWNWLFHPGRIVDMAERGHQAHTHSYRHFNCRVITHTTAGKWESGEQELRVMESIPLLFGLVLPLPLSLSLTLSPLNPPWLPRFRGRRQQDKRALSPDVSKLVKSHKAAFVAAKILLIFLKRSLQKDVANINTQLSKTIFAPVGHRTLNRSMTAL